MDTLQKDNTTVAYERRGSGPDAGVGELESLVCERFRVLVFIPSTNEFQRFVLSGAFGALDEHYDLIYVMSPADKAAIAPELERVPLRSPILELNVPSQRFKRWQQLFDAACFRYASKSRSFAMRANLRFERLDPRLVRMVSSPYVWPVQVALKRVAASPIVSRALRERLGNINALMSQTEQLRFMQPKHYRNFVGAALQELGPFPDLIALMERVNPLFTIMPTSLLDIFCNEVLWACEGTGIPCFALQSGWDNLSSKGVIHHQPAFLGVWGAQSERHARDIQGIVPDKCVHLGAPHYDLLREGSDLWKSEFRASLGLEPEDTLILFGGSFRQFDETEVLRRLDEAIDRGELGRTKIVYRPHPWRADRQDEEDFFDLSWRHIVFDPDMKARYLRAKQEPGYIKRHNPIFDMEYLGRLISAADAVISPMSTLLLEAMLMGKPTMAVAFSDGKHAHNPSVTSQMTHFQELSKSNAIVWCSDPDRFITQTRELLVARESTARGHYAPVLHDLVVTSRTLYSERLADYCRTVVIPQARRLRQVRAARRRETISHAYGAHLIAREYCAIDDKTASVPGYWMHGWIPAFHNVHYALIALHKKPGQTKNHDYVSQIEHEKVHVDQWVSREDQAEFLRAHGYRKVRAIGLPFAYIPEVAVSRCPGTLLVMPPHARRTHGADDPLAETYADMIADMRGDFDEIWVCLNEDDFAKGEWVHSFARRGIRSFIGSDQADPHTHLRLKRILSTFEFVTTNGFGSHIAYAAYCGAKVSVFGPYAEWSRNRMARTHAVQMFPELVDDALELCSERALRTHYPWLFTEPKLAQVRSDWAAQEIGADRRCNPEELRYLFGWFNDRSALA